MKIRAFPLLFCILSPTFPPALDRVGGDDDMPWVPESQKSANLAIPRRGHIWWFCHTINKGYYALLGKDQLLSRDVGFLNFKFEQPGNFPRERPNYEIQKKETEGQFNFFQVGCHLSSGGKKVTNLFVSTVNIYGIIIYEDNRSLQIL